jgi:hypothetical protein
MEPHSHAAQPHSPNGHLARIAEELLEHTRALRRQHEERRDRLAGISAVRPDQPFERPEPLDGMGAAAGRNGDSPPMYPMVLQMALAGETREYARQQLRTLDVEDGDDLVDEVFDRVESQRPNGRRRLFSRRSH